MYDTIDSAIRNLRPKPEIARSDPSTTLLAGKIIAGIVRLVFHDAVEIDPKAKDNLRSDGCISENNPFNAGLTKTISFLNNLWKPFCDKISRADFWYLAAKVAIETSTPYTDYNDSLGSEVSKKIFPDYPRITYFNIPFYYGRKDVDNCTYKGENRVPSPDATSNEYRRIFFDHLGLNSRETVVLIGAHIFGSMTIQNSGYIGVWKRRIDLFDTTFYHQLLTNKWKPQIMASPAGKFNLINQWVIDNATAGKSNAAMLNSDMELLYSIDPKKARETRPLCGPYDPESKTDGCPHIDIVDSLNFNYYTQKYSEGHGNDQDLPGSSRWLHDFARAFNKMCSAGYDRCELKCAKCVTPTCLNCKHKELCEGPQYGEFHDQYDDSSSYYEESKK